MPSRRPPLVLAALLLAAVPTSAPRAAQPVLRLRPNGQVFWEAFGQGAQSCGSGCARWQLVVQGRGERLRVAVDAGSGVALVVTDPDGAQRNAANSFSAELFLAQPKAGTWTVEATGPAGTRLRARLDATVPAPRGTGPLLPNLRLVPPYEFTFAGGCQPDEIVEHGAKECLRFSIGPENAGDGALRVRFEPLTGLVLSGNVFQIVEHADGRTSERLAGTFEYHKTHAHYHHSGFGSLELFRVDDASTGRLTRVGTGPKQGFCMIDLKLADWQRFYQAPAGSVRQDCEIVAPPTGAELGLSKGWTDIYTFGLSGNYVEFSAAGDGRYVVRSVADALGQVQETNETDNAAYAYIEVRGETVKVLERGRGLSPWDPRKVVVDDRMRPTMTGGGAAAAPTPHRH